MLPIALRFYHTKICLFINSFIKQFNNINMVFPTIDFNNLPLLPLSQKSNLPRCPAIYFILNQQQEVLYIGRSINLLYRWRDHHRFLQLREINKIQPVFIYWWECQPKKHNLISAENYYINLFKPLLNSTIVPTVYKGDFSIFLTQLARNTIIAGLFVQNNVYELILIYAWNKKYESRKIANILKKCPSSIVWDKHYIQKTPYWIADYKNHQLSQPFKLKILPCIKFGLFWQECTKSSIPTLVFDVPMKIVDWRTNYLIPNEENFVDVSKLDELIVEHTK